MNKAFVLALIAVSAVTSAFADEVAKNNDQRVWIFPPITQTLGYTYSKPFRVPVPTSSNLASFPTSSSQKSNTDSQPQTDSKAVH